MINIFKNNLSNTDISDKGKKQLITMSYERLVFGTRTMPFAGAIFIAWPAFENTYRPLLWAWLFVYLIVAIVVGEQKKRYFLEYNSPNDKDFVKKWSVVVRRLALIHGTGIGILVPFTVGISTFEYALVMHISIAAIVASNAAHQTPLLGAFVRYLIASWGITLISIPWTFPEHWQMLLPLSILYLLVIFRHSLMTNRFFMQQVQHEEESASMAEKYRLEKIKAENALQAKNQFLETASHDLRQPVQAMSFLIEAIARKNTNSELVSSLDDLRTSIRSVHLMFNSLLDLSKIESGNIKIKKSSVDIYQLMFDITALFTEEAKSRGLRLRTRAPRNATIITDPALLRQSLMNLLHNALRYTLKGGVLISARLKNENWLFEVWDTGIGIASDEQKNIYSPHYRNEHAWRVDNAGHGLGLAVVARCADLLGATYGVQSRIGKGSRFWLSIQKHNHSVDAESAPLSIVANTEVLPRLSGTTLMIDDDPMVTRAFSNLMEAWGINSRVADSGPAALSMISEGFEPQMIFCDQRLRSGESGFDVLKDLLSKLPDTQGAMISGEYDSPELQKAEEEGYMVLSKPLNVSQLHAVLTAACGNHQGESNLHTQVKVTRSTQNFLQVDRCS